jgi:MmyB-like transcription regulator ligand binding domain/Helix-turn-helix domain
MVVVATVPQAERRAELAAFLRSRRAVITPETAGLAPGPRRRTPGLRREELAQLAGVGVTWYTWLEQGRPINASTQVLDAVARVLRLDRSEHAHLYRLADVPEVPVDDGSSTLPADIQTILDGFTSGPACVYNGKFDLLAWNADYAAVFPAITAEGADRNALRYSFRAAGGDNPLGTPEVLAHMVAITRATYGRHVGEPEWTTWLAELSRESELFASMWADGRVAEPMPTVRRFSCSGAQTFHARVTSFAVSGVADTRMIVYIPAEDADAALVTRLRHAAA